MLSCPHCEKNSAFWEDGTAWKVKPTVCPKCQSEVTHKTTKSKKYITITYTCTSCDHVAKVTGVSRSSIVATEKGERDEQ